jgi:hypothetical protein
MDTPYWDGFCEIKDCARVRSFSDCSYCKLFPCELLLDISLDPDDGDDGERLETLRIMKDTRENRKTALIRKIVIGASIGAIAGLLLGGITGGSLNWFYALGGGDYHAIAETPQFMWVYITLGTIIGTLIPIIIEIIKRYNKNV